MFRIHFKTGVDLAAVAASWVLVLASLSVATFVITPEQGVGYFLAYAVALSLGSALYAVYHWGTAWAGGRSGSSSSSA